MTNMASGNADYRKLESLIYTTGAHDRLLKQKEDEIGKKLTKLRGQMETLEEELQDARDKKREKDDELEAFLASLTEEKRNEVLRQSFEKIYYDCGYESHVYELGGYHGRWD
jgi:vacuolar-type H+-ATPase subunit I/STV1